MVKPDLGEVFQPIEPSRMNFYAEEGLTQGYPTVRPVEQVFWKLADAPKARMSIDETYNHSSTGPIFYESRTFIAPLQGFPNHSLRLALYMIQRGSPEIGFDGVDARLVSLPYSFARLLHKKTMGDRTGINIGVNDLLLDEQSGIVPIEGRHFSYDRTKVPQFKKVVERYFGPGFGERP